ncbi:MAG TPA: TolC family protein [Anaeromyxobacteraceae bacterium]|nr:TolC family protein [Anaeromyxobacteraceae bacterium]
MRTFPLAACLLLPAAAGAAPLTLDDALAVAAKHNGDLEVARAVREVAAVDLYQSWSGVLPRLDLTGAFGRTYYANQKSVQPFPNGSGGIDLVVVPTPDFDVAANQLTLTLRWTLFDGFASWNRISSARASARAADRQLDESTLQIAFEVTRRFYEVVKQERALRVRQEAAARSEDLVRRADALYAAGRGTKADTFSARVNLGNDRIAVEAQQASLVRARTDLAVALGLSRADGLDVVAPAPVSGPGLPSQAEPAALDELLARARRDRPLLAARESAVAAAELQISQARGGYWPALGVQGTYQRPSPYLSGSYGVLGDPSHQYVATAQVTLAWNLFQGRETMAAAQRAEVQARRARVEAAQAEQVVSAEIARARESVVTLGRTTALAQENLGAAEQGLALARERLEAGVASQLEVRDATQKLSEAQLALVSALVDHAVARADLNRAVGGSL